MRTPCRSRQCLEGWLGRRRTYQCRTPGCPNKFHVDTRNPLPENLRYCLGCQGKMAKSLDIDVMISIRQGIFFRDDMGVYLNDIDYLRCLEYREAQ